MMLTINRNTSGPDFLLSQMMQETFQQGGKLPVAMSIAITLCLGTLALIGLIGNILVVIFFYRGLHELPQNVYVIALATLDLTVCSVVIPSTIYQDVWRAATTDLMCKTFHILRCSLVTSSAFLLCLIAVDRFAIICFVPGIQTGRRRAVRLIGLTLLLGFAVGTPLGLTTGTRRTVNIRIPGRTISKPVTMAHCTADYSILPMFTVKVYKACLTMLFLCMLLAIMFFYANIFYFVRRRQRRWDKSRSYVSRVSGGKDNKDGGKRCRSLSVNNPNVDDSDKIMVCCSHGSRPNNGVLETDIDRALGGGQEDAARTPPPAAVVNFPNNVKKEQAEEAKEEDEQEEALKTAEAPEQRRMLGGNQRREDSVVSNRLAQAQRHLSERTRKRPHIKTAKVLSIITFFYLLSYLPFFLVFHLQEASAGASGGATAAGPMPMRYPQGANLTDWQSYQAAAARFRNWSSAASAAPGSNYSQQHGSSISSSSSSSSSWWHRLYSRSHGGISGSEVGSDEGSRIGLGGLFMQTVYYFYFINHGVNPVIYGCMNTFFKQQVCGMLNSIRLRCRRSC